MLKNTITIEELKAINYVKLDNRTITDQEWKSYHESYVSWLNTKYESEMHKAMRKPNAPNQMYSNNH